MHKKNIFITSTGTSLGKTYCSVEILKELAKRKIEVNGFKPILSGFNFNNIDDSDSYKILETRKIMPKIEDIKEITPWLFKSPIAPSIAAIKDNKSLKYEEVLNWCLKNNYKVNYLDINNDFSIPYIDKLIRFIDKNKVKKLLFFEIEDKPFEKKLIKSLKSIDILSLIHI